MDDNLNQNVGVDDEEEQPSQPDPHKGVVAFKLQEVGGAKPGCLQEGKWVNVDVKDSLHVHHQLTFSA